MKQFLSNTGSTALGVTLGVVAGGTVLILGTKYYVKRKIKKSLEKAGLDTMLKGMGDLGNMVPKN